VRRLGALTAPRTASALAQPPSTLLDAADERIVAAMAGDGRASYAALAETAGISEPTVRRRLGRLLDSRRIAVRCDLAWEVVGWPVPTTVALRVPADQLDEVDRSLTVLPDVRLVAACVGEADLIVSRWPPALADGHRFAAMLTDRYPRVRVVRRLTGLRTVKRMGQLLDDRGRARTATRVSQEHLAVRRP
jgi:DNA-binding Lrp family transcriptional regulator